MVKLESHARGRARDLGQIVLRKTSLAVAFHAPAIGASALVVVAEMRTAAVIAIAAVDSSFCLILNSVKRFKKANLFLTRWTRW